MLRPAACRARASRSPGLGDHAPHLVSAERAQRGGTEVALGREHEGRMTVCSDAGRGSVGSVRGRTLPHRSSEAVATGRARAHPNTREPRRSSAVRAQFVADGAPVVCDKTEAGRNTASAARVEPQAWRLARRRTARSLAWQRRVGYSDWIGSVVLGVWSESQLGRAWGATSTLLRTAAARAAALRRRTCGRGHHE
jgi:hypothetical protein